MNFNSIYKPVHIRCNKCHADLEYNPIRIKQRLEMITSRYMAVQRSLPNIPDKNTREEQKKYAERLRFEMKLLKEDINMINVMAKEEITAKMLHKLRLYVGDEIYKRFAEEAESEFSADNIFHTYETAIQNYSTIGDTIERSIE